MGSRGPVPKRSEERRRRNKEGETERVPAAGAVEVPELREGLHPLAAEVVDTLAGSAQSRFFEPSDWWLAKLLAEAVDDYMAGRRSATKLAEIRALATELMMSEGQRRRLRLEIDRDAGGSDEDAQVTAIDEYRRDLGA